MERRIIVIKRHFSASTEQMVIPFDSRMYRLHALLAQSLLLGTIKIGQRVVHPKIVIFNFQPTENQKVWTLLTLCLHTGIEVGCVGGYTIIKSFGCTTLLKLA